MFKFNELSEVQIEITNKCQASCPMCSRNVRGGLTNERLKDAEWTLDAYKTIFNTETLLVLKHIIYCGCYGDPMLHNNMIDMIEYSLSVNPKLKISVNTNGGARNTDWWIRLGTVLKDANHVVVFGIDGLENTHHLYRIGTTYERVIANAQALISTGANVHWQFILFEHNEHQVDEARKRSVELGFNNFTLIDTYRFVITDEFDVYDRNNHITHTLKKSKQSNIKEFKIDWIKNYKEILNNTVVDCEAKRIKGIYIDVFYHLYPCCYIAGSIYNSSRYNDPLPGPDEEVKVAWRTGSNELLGQIVKTIDKMGGADAINTYKRPIKEILEDGTYGRVWEQQWTGDDKNIQCTGICGKNTEWSTSADQFNTELFAG